MIQRLQTIWLLIAAVCAILTFDLAFYSGVKLSDTNIKQFVELNALADVIIMVLTGLVALICLVTMFLFQNRKMQLRLTIVALLASIANLVIYFAETTEFTEGNILLTSIFTFIIPVFLVMAAKGIYRDEKLVKSMDRLR
ncbi:MAG: DUF4293 domain-containing protein [Chitinophagaceae bacterium]|jgi:membrane-associated HD superfamily phosphohydrolase|nr:DUF4293 domain-containing protein [Chitinophagaceae bacterium]